MKDNMKLRNNISIMFQIFKSIDEEKFAEMSKQIEKLKNQCEIDNQELKKKVLEQNEECKRLNNRLQEAKVLFQNYSNMLI